MANYSFVTRWRFDAPIEPVWDAIRRYKEWPHWWPSIAEARLITHGDSNGIGEAVEFAFRTRLPYRLRFRMTTVRIVPPRELDGRAEGELRGTGRWRLAPDDGGTRVTYYWDVQTASRWMNLLAPIARPVFRWNHDQVMEDGRRGLARLLAHRAPATAATPARG
ncbi:MAG: SRPBCC family protein [Dehalococcoidia bacterium]